jgi:uncharacterized membrane protein
MDNDLITSVPKSDAARIDGEDVKRVGALSDGVFAIAITLLVLDLKLPDPSAIQSSSELRSALAQWSDYEAYVLSFVVIALYWEGHWKTFKRMATIDRTALWLNMALLLGIAFIPYPTSIISEFGEYRSGTIFYAAVLSAIGFVWAGFWHYSERNGLLTPSNDPDDARYTRYQLLLTPIVFALSIPIAMQSPDAAKYSWLLIFFGRFLFPVWRQIGTKKS